MTFPLLPGAVKEGGGRCHELVSGFGRHWRILRRREFLRIQGEGRKFVTDHFLVFSLANGLDHPRIGITVSRKVGNSVVRNRVKRLVREVFRQNKGAFPRGRDVVVVARSCAGQGWLEQATVCHELLAYCQRTARPAADGPPRPAGPARPSGRGRR